MMQNETVPEDRLTRRQLLKGALLSGGGLAALAVVGCGDDEETGGAPSGGTYPDPGISDTEIKVGTILPLSGPVAPGIVDVMAPSFGAYFDYVNDELGGVDGRKINWLLKDGAYNPATSLELVRTLVEQDQVFALYFVLGTPINAGMLGYLEPKKVPNLHVGTGATLFSDATAHPYITQSSSYLNDGKIIGAYVKKELSSPKIAVIRQNDDLGQTFLEGLQQGLGGSTAIVSTQTYEATDQTLDVQVLKSKDSGANVLAFFGIQRHNVIAMKQVITLGWKPALILGTTGPNALATIKLYGAEYAKGAISVFAAKDPSDPQWADDKAMKDAKEIVRKYGTNINTEDPYIMTAIVSAKLLVRYLKDMKEASREGLLKAVRSLKGFDADGLLLPGVVYESVPGRNYVVSKGRIATFDGTRWVQTGDVIDAEKI